MIRITTNGTLRGYRSNLARSSKHQYDAMQTVLTQRQFHSFSDDPAAATRSFRFHSQLSRIQDQINNSTSVIGKFESAEDCLAAVSKQYREEVGSSMMAENAPTGAGVNALGKQLKGLAESMTKTLNTQYGDSFIFAGSDGQNVPFEIKSTGTTNVYGVETKGIYFRGLDLASNSNVAALDKIGEETLYVDIGLGLTLNPDGTAVPSTAYNSALVGSKILGYGTDSDGEPTDIISLAQQLGELYSLADEDGYFPDEKGQVFYAKDANGNLIQQKDAEGNPMVDEDGQPVYVQAEKLSEKTNRMFGKLKSAYDEFVQQYTEIDTRSAYLKNNDSRLNDMSDTVQEQIYQNDQVDLADALTTFAWAQYAYNAALRVGNQVLSQSFIDYMN